MPKQSNKDGRRLILLELNEINFDVVRQYTEMFPGRFQAIENLLDEHQITTTAESEYDHLEPWIQWVSVHTGKSYSEHNVFRLGDIVSNPAAQIFEELEAKGKTIGGISPMNAANKLKNPAYFIPDPWTQTPPDDSWWSRSLGQAVSQAVNDNAQARISIQSSITVCLALLRFASPLNYGLYWKLIIRSKGASWRKALLLDLLLNDIHTTLFKKKDPDFSVLFLNAGAHIQHHYFLNAIPIKNDSDLRNPNWYISDQEDPFGDMLNTYDRILGDTLSLPGVEVIVATGLSQKPYDRIKYYYRLKDHANFLDIMRISYISVIPRMTRDFLIQFSNNEEAISAQNLLSLITVEPGGLPLFGEIDNRGNSLFVTLTYPHKIKEETRFSHNHKQYSLLPHVAFVAIKNGMHQEKGYAFFTQHISSYAPADQSHVKDLYKSIMQHFSE